MVENVPPLRLMTIFRINFLLWVLTFSPLSVVIFLPALFFFIAIFILVHTFDQNILWTGLVIHEQNVVQDPEEKEEIGNRCDKESPWQKCSGILTISRKQVNTNEYNCDEKYNHKENVNLEINWVEVNIIINLVDLQ